MERLLPYLAPIGLDWGRARHTGQFEPSWQLLEGTMIFCDLSGFTSMSERLARHGKVGAEEVTDAINSCFSGLIDLSSEADGGLLKFGGDALLLFFEGADHAVRAAHAAVAMRRQLGSMGRLDTSGGPVRLRISMGMHSGGFHFFLVGDSHRELVITGPGATATVDAEASARPGEIVGTPGTMSLLPPHCAGPDRGAGRLVRAPRVATPPPGTRHPHLLGVDLASYVPSAVRRHLLGGGDQPEHRVAGVAFLRFQGADEMLVREGPDQFTRHLDELVCTVQEAADAYEVTFLGSDIDRDGGKIILVAGVPRRVGDDEERLLSALRHIADANPVIPVRMGVHAGEVFAGDVGTAQRRTFTVMGDTVNLAARLTARAGPSEIVATLDVLTRSRLAFVTTPLEPFVVKGKRKPVTASFVGAAERRRQFDPGTLPFVGRVDELDTVVQDLNAVLGGGGRLIQIVGEQGIGKTRLVAEVRRIAESIPNITIVCEGYEATTPYAPFWRLGRYLIGLDGTASRNEVVGCLHETVQRDMPELVPMLPLLGIPFDVDIPDTPQTQFLDPEFRQKRADEVTAAFLVQALPTPAVLVFEDVQDMDRASCGLLRQLVRRMTDRSLLLVTTNRETEGDLVEPGPGVRTIPLRPLDMNQALDALATVTDQSPMLPGELRTLAERAEGNPMFLEELLHVRLSGTGIEALPQSVDAAVTALIDRLPPERRRILCTAAVLGRTFTRKELDDLLSAQPPTSLIKDPTEELDRLLVTVAPHVWQFRSEILRDCAYERLSYRHRRDLHRRAAEAITRRLGNDAEAEAELLSLHFFHARSFDDAWHYARLAGFRARDKYANADAVSLLERALAAAKHLSALSPQDVASVWEALGDVSERAGLYDPAMRAYRNARRLVVGAAVQEARLCLKEAKLPERVGRYSEAIRWVNRGLRLLEGCHDVEAVGCRARLRVWYATVRQAQGRSKEAILWCEKAIGDAQAASDPKPEADGSFVLDWALVSLGRGELATNSERALEIYARLGDLNGEATVLNNLGAFAYFEGRWDEAITLYERGRDAHLRSGNDVDAASGTCNIGEVLAEQGRGDEAEPCFREALRVWRAAGYKYGVGYAHLLIGRLAAHQARFADAYDEFSTARDHFVKAQLPNDVLEVDARTAECLMLEGRPSEALALIDHVQTNPALDEGSYCAVMVYRVRGLAIAQLEDGRDARVLFESGLKLARARRANLEVALLQRALAGLARAEGDLPRAQRFEDEATALLKRLGVRSLPNGRVFGRSSSALASIRTMPDCQPA